MDSRGRTRDSASSLAAEAGGAESRSDGGLPEVRFGVVRRGFVANRRAVKVLVARGSRSRHLKRGPLSARRETLVLLVASVLTLFLVGWIADLVLYSYTVGVIGSYDTYRAQVDEAWAVAVGSAVLMFLSLSHYTRLKRDGIP